jgi:pimeloyl-ACP methyl ester carboxylesterase
MTSDMPDDSSVKERSLFAGLDDTGRPKYSWQLTADALKDVVKLRLPPNNVLPIIFVPGIMGSNLCSKDGRAVWLLNGVLTVPYDLVWKWAARGAAARQAVLHPDRTKVFDGGRLPSKIVGTIHERDDYKKRGWGQVAETSYHKFLLWLEQTLNEVDYNPANWSDFSYEALSPMPEKGAPKVEPKLFEGILMKMRGLPTQCDSGVFTESIKSDDLLKRAKCRFPVYAFGYNWLQSNDMAAKLLEKRIQEVIEQNNKGQFSCSQVILVTHSMGGLVARSCVNRPGVADKVAGVVHGVMPAVGAAVAYRRCKIGMYDESALAGLVIGKDGRQVTAVFAQAPGALQLLPSADYRKRWLKIVKASGEPVLSLPQADPYSEIYLEKNKWWGLVNQDWLAPDGGVRITWKIFEKNVIAAREFHSRLSGKYHPNTFVFYGGTGEKRDSFETVTWTLKRGNNPREGTRLSEQASISEPHERVRENGASPIYIGGDTEVFGSAGIAYSPIPMATTYETSFWEAHCSMHDGCGDGTVPVSSGESPRITTAGHVRQQFRISGIAHEPAYQDATVQQVVQYAITKISAKANIL